MKKNEYLIIKEDLFQMINCVTSQVMDKVDQSKIDSQAIFAYTKLIDSYIKIVEAEQKNKVDEDAVETNNISLEDELVINLYLNKN
jgi:hypothetical protein